MRKFLVVTLLLLILLAGKQMASGQDRTLGLGTALGGPDGLSYKYWMSETSALAGVVSFAIAENQSRFYTHFDYLTHKFYDELDWETGRVYYYYGGGLGYEWQQGRSDDVLTVRLPSGLGFDMVDIPVGGFFELAPTITLSPDLRFAFVGNFGFRFYLN